MKIAIIGMGSIGHRHRENIMDLHHYAYSYDPRHDPLPVRSHLIERCDAVIIASPTKEHAKDLIDVLDAGKHVLVEKPIGYDCPPMLDGLIMGARHRYPDLIMATGFNLRFHSCVRYVADHLGELGEIQAAGFSVLQKSTKPDYLRDGIIRNWLSHEIDLAHFLLGQGYVEACTVDDQVEANITMTFPRVKGKVWITGDYITEPHQRYFWIEGSQANFYVNLERREVIKKDQSGLQNVFIGTDTWDQNYMDEMQCFISSIKNKIHTYPLATAEDGVRALYTVMDAYNVAAIGTRLPRPDLSNMQ